MFVTKYAYMVILLGCLNSLDLFAMSQRQMKKSQSTQNKTVNILAGGSVSVCCCGTIILAYTCYPDVVSCCLRTAAIGLVGGLVGKKVGDYEVNKKNKKKVQ